MLRWLKWNTWFAYFYASSSREPTSKQIKCDTYFDYDLEPLKGDTEKIESRQETYNGLPEIGTRLSSNMSRAIQVSITAAPSFYTFNRMPRNEALKLNPLSEDKTTRSLKGPSSWTKNQLNTRQFTKRKSNEICVNTGNPHRHRNSKDRQAKWGMSVIPNCVKGVGAWSFTGKEHTSQGSKKSSYLVEICAYGWVTEVNFLTVNTSYSGKDPPS